MMQSFEAASICAVIGTERQPYKPAAEGSGADKLLLEATSATPEDALLMALAVHGSWNAAGARPVAAPPSPEPLGEEPQPPCTPKASELVRTAIELKAWELVREMTGQLAAGGMVAGAPALPDLLAVAMARPDLKECIVAVLGRRGEWLAARNPAWQSLVGLMQAATGEGVWEDLVDKRSRGAFLRKLRGTDPARARELLAACWKTEQAPVRAVLLESFGAGLSIDDEEFLEAALSDRSSDVRELAAEHLSRLPGSAFSGRMKERARAAIRADGSKVDFEPPKELSKQDNRDGIHLAKLPGLHNAGERGGALYSIVRLAPLDSWKEFTGLGPAEFLAACARSDWKDAVTSGLIRATASQENRDWAVAHFLRDPRRILGIGTESIGRLIPSDIFQAAVQNHLSADFTKWLEIIPFCEGPWGVTFSREALERICNFLKSRMGQPNQAGYGAQHNALEALHAAACRADAEVVTEFLDNVHSLAAALNWGERPTNIARILQLRSDFAKEMAR